MERHDITYKISDFFPSKLHGRREGAETGYGYFGARYIDHKLMTMWLCVDPLADKYPGISPYAYCAWNPVKLVDPDGMDTLSVYFNSTDNTYSMEYARGGNNVIIGPDGKQQLYNDDVDVCQYRFYSDGQNVLSADLVNVDATEDPIFGFAVENEQSQYYMPASQYTMRQNEQSCVDANPVAGSTNTRWQGYMVFFSGRKFHWGNATNWSDGCVVSVGKDDVNIASKNNHGWLTFNLSNSQNAYYTLTEYFGGKKGNQNYKFWNGKKAVTRPAITWGGKQPTCKWEIRDK